MLKGRCREVRLRACATTSDVSWRTCDQPQKPVVKTGPVRGKKLSTRYVLTFSSLILAKRIQRGLISAFSPPSKPNMVCFLELQQFASWPVWHVYFTTVSHKLNETMQKYIYIILYCVVSAHNYAKYACFSFKKKLNSVQLTLNFNFFKGIKSILLFKECANVKTNTVKRKIHQKAITIYAVRQHFTVCKQGWLQACSLVDLSSWLQIMVP